MSNFSNHNGHIRPIMIGDYADLTIKDKTYRYYIIKIDPNQGITIGQMDNPEKRFLLVNDNDIWLNEGLAEMKIPHTVSFTKNATELRYIERDFTKAPTKFINITRKDIWWDSFELRNGIILCQTNKNSGKYEFSDPSNISQPPDPNLNLQMFENSTIFLSAQIINGRHSDIFNLVDNNGDNDEVFMHLTCSGIIAKLNLNDLTYTTIDQNPQYKTLYPLKGKKILCLLQDYTMYILDVTTRTKIAVNYSKVSFDILETFQFSNGDIILQCKNVYQNRQHNEGFFQVNINDGNIQKLTTDKNFIDILAVLPDDNFLIWNIEINTVQLWDPLGDKSVDLYTIKFEQNNDNHEYQDLPVSTILANGDVLFTMDKIFYLFDYKNRKVINLPLFITRRITGSIKSLQQLRNGNILITNGTYLNIMEFPYSQSFYDRQTFDQINPRIKVSLKLPPDMLALIRSYL